MKSLFLRFWGFVQYVGWRKIAIVAAGFAVGLTGAHVIFSSGTGPVVQENVRQVSLDSVANLSNQGAPLSIVGTVNSVSQATVNAQSAGAVTAVYHALGDNVSAGTIVAELDDASQRAAVLQAQGAVDAAQANVDKVQGPTGASAKLGAVTALLSAYATVDSAIRGAADPMFDNPNGGNPQFLITTSNSQLVGSINSTRVLLGDVWQRETNKAKSLSATDDLNTELTTTLSEVRQTRTFIDTILQALNTAIPTPTMSQATINGYITTANTARASLTAALSSLASAQASVTTVGTSGGADVAAALAGLKQAQGALAAARANLEKSIIRAPISGTINSLNLKRGDFVAMNAAVLTVANNGSLEIVGYVTEADASDIAVGTKVAVDGGQPGQSGSGTITRVAPALDPITKKIEVRVALAKANSLINGQSVLLTIPRTTKSPSQSLARITIPISALKVGANDTVVFTVASSTLVAHNVALGELLGDRVVIASGLTPNMMIVIDARGLREGQVVDVQ